MVEIIGLLRQLAEMGGSDLYIIPGTSPRINVNGKFFNACPESLTPEDTRQIVRQMLTEDQWSEFYQKHELNIAYSLREVSRFRVNVYFQRGAVAAVVRQLRCDMPSFGSLNLPPILGQLVTSSQGMILVTGATGCGKSTTMAAMINYRAENMDGHIITIEDPVEYLFQHKKSIITQREVGIDTFSFKEALKNCLRQAPHVIYIGELRDSETVEFAMHSAETGHLVLSTLHSSNAYLTIERIMNFFSKENHHQVLMQLSYDLKAIICQRLIPSQAGARLPVLEILINTALVQEMIQKEEIGQLKKIMEAGRQEGMQTFDTHLKDLVEKKMISEEMALKFADSASDLRLRLRGFESSSF